MMPAATTPRNGRMPKGGISMDDWAVAGWQREMPDGWVVRVETCGEGAAWAVDAYGNAVADGYAPTVDAARDAAVAAWQRWQPVGGEV